MGVSDSPVYTDSALNVILKTVFGGYYAGNSELEDNSASSTATSVTVASTGGGQWSAPGGGVMATTIAGRLEARETDLRSGDVLTPKVGFSAAPTNQATIYNGHTIYLDEAAATSLAFVVETADRDNVYWLLGMQCTSISLSFTLGQVAKLSFTFEGADWKQDDSVGTPIGGSAISVASFTDAAPPVYVNNQCFFCTGSEPYTYSTSLVHPSAVDITLALKWQAVPSPNGVNGILGWVLIPESPMASVTLTLPVDSGNIKTYQAAQLAQTIYGFWMQIGNAAGNTVLISLPSLQITNVQQAESTPSLHGMQITGEAIEDQDNAGTSAQYYSPVRIHRV